jgi:metallo-beta-lactamase class B
MHSAADVSRRTLLAGLAALGATAPARAQDEGAPDIWELPVEGMERVDQTVWVKSLTPDIWITCCTFFATGLGYVPTNGLIVAADSGPTIVDTGTTRDQGDLLLRITEQVTRSRPVQAIATHFHDDRTGGIEAMRAANIPVYAHPFSVGLAQAYGVPVPAPLPGLEKGPVSLGPLELFFPGPGHTRDNITAWHAESRTLFGGCLLRATTDDQLGSAGDADFAALPQTLAHLDERYPERRLVIPGHGAIAGDALAWTRELAAALLSNGARP